ncbi:MAG: NAD(P)/FAD-dependent oxidoreductase [Candidatus Babeliales bacterium]
MQKRTHIIIGASAAGMGVLNQLRTLDPESNIVCIARDTAWPYNTCFLADYLSGTKQHEQLALKPQEFFEKNSIKLMLGKEVISIDRVKRTITLSDSTTYTYDTLFLGTGVSPRTLTLEGADTSDALFYFHTHDDAIKIKEFILNKPVKRAVVIGAGLSGLEVADSLNKNGIAVTIVEQSLQVLQHHADRASMKLLKELALSHNTTIMVNNAARALVTQNDKLVGLDLVSGERIDTSIIVIAIGALANSALARDAGLAIEYDAIVVNDVMQTSDPAIFAGGDVCLVRERVSNRLMRNGAWPDAMHQGLIAAHSMAGVPKSYPGAVNIISSAFFGVHFFSCGPVMADDHGYKIKIMQGDGFYHKFLFEGDILKGFLLVGNTQKAAEYRKFYLAQVPFPFF